MTPEPVFPAGINRATKRHLFRGLSARLIQRACDCRDLGDDEHLCVVHLPAQLDRCRCADCLRGTTP